MIKRERDVLTYMGQEVNGIPRDDFAAGRNFAQTIDAKLSKALSKVKENREDEER